MGKKTIAQGSADRAALYADMPTNSHYSHETMIQACAMFAIHGNAAQVSREMNIPETTICGWRKMEWWQSRLEDIRREHNDTLDARLTKVIDRALSGVEESLGKGEWVGTDDDGNALYRPVRAKDAATITGILFDKRQILRAQPTQIKVNVGLDDLRSRFEEIAASKERIVSEQ